MHGADPILDSVSRRTRSRLDAFYRNRYNEIRKKSDQKSHEEWTVTDDCEQGRRFGSSNEIPVENRARKNDDCVTIHDSDDSDADEQSSDDSDKDYKMHACNNVNEKGSRKVGRPSKKNKDCADDFDKARNMYSYNHVMEKGSRKVGRHSKKKNSGLIGELDLVNLMKDSIWKEKDSVACTLKERASVKAKLALIKENVPSESTLPLKFRFEDSSSSSAEKTDPDRKIQSLFDDLEMGLCESEIECTNPSMTDDKCATSAEMDESPLARCRRGEHDPVLDEQIGFVCKCCHNMVLEMKYVLPALGVEQPQKRPGKKGVEDLDNSFMDKIQFQGNACGKLESSPCSQGTVLELIPDGEPKLYPHQVEGFEFLWRNIAGDIHINKLERLLSPDGGRGCIISHAPGTGKTRLTILFLQTFLEVYPSCHAVIIAPCGLLLNWEQEFRKWNVDITFHNLNENKLSQEETAFADSIVDQAPVNKNHIDYIRFIKLYSWIKGMGILGVGYRLFEELANGDPKKQCSDQFKKMLLELPGLLVLDEGHTPRNDKSLMWEALTKVKTQRRIMLSGTPFQNNFSELYNTLCLVNPRFSHQIIPTDSNSKNVKRRGRKRKANAARDEWDYLTSSIGNDASSEDKLKKLRSMIEPFVHIHNGCILQKALPGLRECLILLRPTDLQSQLLQNLDRFDKFIEKMYISSLISVHPFLVAEKPQFVEHQKTLESLKTDSTAGVKTHVLIKLVQLSVRQHDKVLVFSEFLDPLEHIQQLLKEHFSWTEREVMYMRGDLNTKQRQQMINSFNDKKGEAKVLLASLRACCEGINLVGASRVVLLDVVWNPSVERQAICRAHRLGQEKMVYVYRLVIAMQVSKYAKQAEKHRFNELIFRSADGVSSKSRTTSCPGSEAVVPEDKMLEAMVGEKSIARIVERIVLQPKESDFVNTWLCGSHVD